MGLPIACTFCCIISSLYLLRILHFKWKWQSRWRILIRLECFVTIYVIPCHPSDNPPWGRVFWQPEGGGGGHEVHSQVEWFRGGRPSLSQQHGEIIICHNFLYDGHISLVRASCSGAPLATWITRTPPRRTAPPTRSDRWRPGAALYSLYLFLAWNCGRRWLWSLAESWALILYLVNSSV